MRTPANAGWLIRLMKKLAVIFGLFAGCAFPAWLAAATLHVDGANGSDSANGLTPATAWRTIQRAANVVNPGDLVSIQPGVYAESVAISRTGTAALPITFRATGPGVVVSGAHAAIRAGQTGWVLENAALQLYSTTHATLTTEPATVLSDNVDLFAYATLAELQTFTLASANNSGKTAPGPQHGFAYSGGKLYVRLNARYGSQNPTAHVIKVSPPRAGGFRGDVIQAPTDYNWSVQTTVPAHVLLDGFTCESPGYTGVWIKAGAVTVKNCTFLGCRTGVRGWGAAENQPLPSEITDDVIVQGCEYSQYPAWQDMLDVVAAAEALTAPEQAQLPAFFWWSRKGGARSSELGLVVAAGRRWKLLGNYVHNTIDGVSFMSVSWSDECEIAYNRFEKLLDNAVESENHAFHLRAHHNFVRDVYEPFSCQPNGGAPYPASIWFYRNIVTLTPEATAFWQKPILAWTPGCFKIKPSGSTFTSIGLDGLLCFNNTIHFPSGNVLTLNTLGANAGTIRFFNNIVVAKGLQVGVTTTFPGTEFSHNLVAPAAVGQPGPGSIFAGVGGQTVPSALALGLENFAAGRFALAPASPAIGGGELIPGVLDSSTDIGALPLPTTFQRFDQWRFQYFYDALFDPLVSGPVADPDGDGLPNVFECLHGRLPLTADGSGTTLTGLDSLNRLKFSFIRRLILPEDLSWLVEASANFTAWESGPGVIVTRPPTAAGPGLKTENVSTIATTGGAPVSYLRLRATQLDLPPGRVPLNDPPPVSGVGDLVLDPFTDSSRTNGTDPLDTAWFSISPPNGGTAPTLSVVDDTTGLGAGMALFINNVTNPSQTASKSLVAAMPRTTLAATGDQLTLSFQFRLAHIAASHSQNTFRFGLYDSQSNPFTADNQYKPGHKGYLASVNFGTSTAVPALLRESGLEGNVNSGSDVVAVGSFGTAALSVGTAAAGYSAALTFTKTATGVTARLRLLASSGAVLLDQTASDTTPLTTFDEIIFSTSQSEADYLLDNVTVNFSPASP